MLQYVNPQTCESGNTCSCLFLLLFTSFDTTSCVSDPLTFMAVGNMHLQWDHWSAADCVRKTPGDVSLCGDINTEACFLLSNTTRTRMMPKQRKTQKRWHLCASPCETLFWLHFFNKTKEISHKNRKWKKEEEPSLQEMKTQTLSEKNRSVPLLCDKHTIPEKGYFSCLCISKAQYTSKDHFHAIISRIRHSVLLGADLCRAKMPNSHDTRLCFNQVPQEAHRWAAGHESCCREPEQRWKITLWRRGEEDKGTSKSLTLLEKKSFWHYTCFLLFAAHSAAFVVVLLSTFTYNTDIYKKTCYGYSKKGDLR